MIHGASGAIGVMVLQYLKAVACNVTAVCRGAIDALVRLLGAGAVVDCTTSDYGDVAIERCELRTQGRALNRLGGTSIGNNRTFKPGRTIVSFRPVGAICSGAK